MRQRNIVTFEFNLIDGICTSTVRPSPHALFSMTLYYLGNRMLYDWIYAALISPEAHLLRVIVEGT